MWRGKRKKMLFSKIKLTLRKLQEVLERRFVGNFFHELAWRTRHVYRRRWAEQQLSTVNHPHREQIVEAVHSFSPFDCLLELGCGAGANLIRLRERFPNIVILGIDVNRNALQVATRYFIDSGEKNVTLKAGSVTLIDLPSKSVDVVVCDAVLMFITPNEIRLVIKEILRVARRGIVLNEYSSPVAGESRFLGGRWAHDFRSLILSEAPSCEVSLVPTKFSGGLWDEVGNMVTARL